MTGALAALAALIQRTTGMMVPPGRETALRLAVARAAPGLEPEDYLLATKDPVYGPGLVDRAPQSSTHPHGLGRRTAGRAPVGQRRRHPDPSLRPA